MIFMGLMQSPVLRDIVRKNIVRKVRKLPHDCK